MVYEKKSKDTEDKSSGEEEKTWCIEDFELHSIVGTGRFGKVYFAREKVSQYPVAIKTINKASIAEDMKDQVFQEIAIHSLFRHPHIIPQLMFFNNEQTIFTVMEYAEYNSLHNVMRSQKYKRFNENDAAKYICQVADALEHMHRRQYIHRDIKPENILVDSRWNAKIGDFGWATSSCCKPQGCCGTAEYMAPEVIQGRVYNHTVDNWCLGVMTYELLVGRGPFRSNKPKTTVYKILGRKMSFPQIVASASRNLILSLVEIEPKKRLPLKEVMSHRWIQSHYEGSHLHVNGL